MTIPDHFSSANLDAPAPADVEPRVATVNTQNQWPPIGQLFVDRGHLTAAELESALAEQRETGERLGEILVRRGHIQRLDLASALSTQWSWKDEASSPTVPQLTPVPPHEEHVEPEPIEPEPIEPEPVLVAAPEPTIERGLWLAPPSTEIDAEPAPPVGTELFTELVGRVSGLEDQDGLLRDVQAQLREVREQLASGEARLGSLEAILAEFSQAYARLNARLDAQTRELEELRRVTAEQATRITSAGRALLA